MDSVFLSGPISNDLKGYKQKFAEVEKIFIKHGCTVMNPAIFPVGFKWNQYMNITLPMLDCCDFIYLLPGWDLSEGAKMEHLYADKAGKVILMPGFLDKLEPGSIRRIFEK